MRTKGILNRWGCKKGTIKKCYTQNPYEAKDPLKIEKIKKLKMTK
jgi:hypothetical protein